MPNKTIPAGNAHIVVVGGGFACAALVSSLQKKLPPDARLTLVCEESYPTFNPMLPEAVGASIFPEHGVAPLREVVNTHRDHRFIMGRVSSVDAPFRTDVLPGMSEHDLPLKTAGGAMEIRNVVVQRLARIELENDASVRAQLGHFVVIGGGFSGVSARQRT